MFEAKAEPLREEISNLEHKIIENDKHSTEVLIGVDLNLKIYLILISKENYKKNSPRLIKN